MPKNPIWEKIANVRRLGTPYVRGKAVSVGKNLSRYKADAPVMIGDTVSNQEIYWFEVDNLLVATEPVLCAVPCGTLRAHGLIYGKQIIIDGICYTCRLIQALQKDEVSGQMRISDELHRIQAVVNDWSVFDRHRFLSQEGYFDHESGFADDPNPAMGYAWFPVLEPVQPETKTLIGKQVFLNAGRGGSACGILEYITDYDIVLSGVSMVLLDPNCMVQLSDEKIVVVRDEVSALQEKVNPSDPKN